MVNIFIKTIRLKGLEISRNILVLFILMFLIVSCTKNNEVKLVIFDEYHKMFLDEIILYKKYDIEIINKENYWIIENIKEEILLEILVIVNLKSGIIANNIANINTTRTVNGGPYIRQILKITPENGIEIIEDTNTYTQLRWDPTHPDAILTGERKGYVIFPNVDFVTETVEQVSNTYLKNIIIEYLKLKYNILLL
jgi:flagellar basal-body rod protein FlgC